MGTVRMFSITLQLWLMVVWYLCLIRGQEFETSNGRVRGRRITVMGKPLHVFHGIPFAKSPVGDLRFKHPQSADSWRPKVKDATTEKPSCIQSTVLYDQMPASNSRHLSDDYSEDCLYLSVWKPASANPGSDLAVMIWIYGGGFAHGSSRIPVYNGQYIAAENNVIVVSINYRMGPLGFSYLGPDTIPGNMGMMDQVEGMTWVKNNIAYFGGDKNRITLFGQSTGSDSVGYHLLSPLSRDLFSYGILQSGVPVNKVLKGSISSMMETKESVKKLSVSMNCSGLSDEDIYECFKAATSDTITTAFCSLTNVIFYPIVDGYFLPDVPMTLIESGAHKKANILTGVTKDEITLLFNAFLDPTDKTVMSTGEEFTHEHLQMGITKVTGLTNISILNALKVFYESERSPPIDYLDILNYIGSDIILKCSTLQFSSLYAESNNVYLYSLDHRISTSPYPAWMGVPHSYDLDLVFGLPLNDSLGFTKNEKELSRNIMTYWTNFAKSGNPNSPEPVTANWPVFNGENQTYMVLDVGGNLATKHGFRRHQCAFVNDIVPIIPEGTDNNSNPGPDTKCNSGNGGHCGLECASMVFSLLAVSIRMLKQ